MELSQKPNAVFIFTADNQWRTRRGPFWAVISLPQDGVNYNDCCCGCSEKKILVRPKTGFAFFSPSYLVTRNSIYCIIRVWQFDVRNRRAWMPTIMSLYYIRTHILLILFRNEFVSDSKTGILVRRRKLSYYFVGEDPHFLKNT